MTRKEGKAVECKSGRYLPAVQNPNTGDPGMTPPVAMRAHLDSQMPSHSVDDPHLCEGRRMRGMKI